MKDFLKHIGSTFLLGLLLIKLSAFHVYEEHDNLNGQEHHCEFCLLAIENQQLDSLIVSSPLIDDIFNEPIHQDGIIWVDLSVNLNHSKEEQFTRPPPFIL